MDNCIAMSTYLATALGREALRNTNFVPPSALFLALLGAPTRLNNHAYTLGQYYVSSHFSSTDGSPMRHIFKVTTAGTSGGSEPVFNETEDGLTTDGTAVVTEMTTLLKAQSIAGLELSGNGYARQAVAFSDGVDNGGFVEFQNSGLVTYPQATGTWVQAVGFYIFDSSSGGNGLIHGLFDDAKPVAATDQLQITATSLKVDFE